MSQMFNSAQLFNQNIGSWNVSKVITFVSMFGYAAQFNNGGVDSIKTWIIKPTGTVNMAAMFQGAYNFNQDISIWDTSRVTDMSVMFNAANNFDQDISGWNISNVLYMNSMFASATQFNRNLGAWQLRLSGTNLSSIFSSSGMSTTNYTDTIVGWANYVQTNSSPLSVSMSGQSGRTFDSSRPGGSFIDAGAARTYLTGAIPTGAGWTITS
jgi:surface protein